MSTSTIATPPTEATATARDSITVATWTAVSRVTGVIRVAVVAAALGPTFLGNTYQFTNTVPNLVYYGLLGGSLVSSLLVPAVVRHLDGDPARAQALSGAFLGAAAVAAAACAPVVVAVVPLLLRLGSGSGAVGAGQQHAALVLVVLLIPQMLCYAVIACAVAVMNAHRRFALPSAAPTIENVGTIGVLLASWAWFGSRHEVTDVPVAQLLLLGVGSTLAVVAHAAVQWFGARRCGVVLVPRAGWRDAEARAVLGRAGRATLQAGLWSAQVIVLLALANRLAGGVVAMLIVLNFFYLPVALGAAPIALSALPRLAGHAAQGRQAELGDATVRAVTLGAFVAAPAAAGYLVLARPLAVVVTGGGSARTTTLVTSGLAWLAPAVLAYGVFTVANYASYAREDATRPLAAMGVQTAVGVAAMGTVTALHRTPSLALLAGAFAVGIIAGAVAMVRSAVLPVGGRRQVVLASVRCAACAAVMAAVVWAAELGVGGSGRGVSAAVVAGGVLLGTGVYLAAQRAVRSPELAVLALATFGPRS